MAEELEGQYSRPKEARETSATLKTIVKRRGGE
jgi:hypothetical protein